MLWGRPLSRASVNLFSTITPHRAASVTTSTLDRPRPRPFHSALGSVGGLQRPHRSIPSDPPVSRCWQCGAEVQAPTPTCHQSDEGKLHVHAHGEGVGCGAVQPLSPWTTYFDVFANFGVKLTPSGAWSYDVDLQTIKRRFLRLQQAVHPDAHANKSEEERKYSDIQSTFINKALQTLKDPLLRARYLLHLNDVHLDESEKLKDPELLDEVMSVWEALEGLETRIAKSVKDISDGFKTNNLQAAKNATVELQYWTNLENRLEDATVPR
ncbi:hypothetical protein BC829DRAFT_471776 [Chytridium lagenaria]|nr:hypothetical protein BC829DRAFT_471776 [Chytridium lagenaria]